MSSDFREWTVTVEDELANTPGWSALNLSCYLGEHNTRWSVTILIKGDKDKKLIEIEEFLRKTVHDYPFNRPHDASVDRLQFGQLDISDNVMVELIRDTEETLRVWLTAVGVNLVLEVDLFEEDIRQIREGMNSVIPIP